MSGEIRVTIQEADRLRAITQLSEAIVHVAKALSAVPQVVVTECIVQNRKGGTGIHIDTAPDVTETTILKEDEAG